MILIYEETSQNTLAAKKSYPERFPNRHHPSTGTIVRAVYHLQETGSVIPR